MLPPFIDSVLDYAFTCRLFFYKHIWIILSKETKYTGTIRVQEDCPNLQKEPCRNGKCNHVSGLFSRRDDPSPSASSPSPDRSIKEARRPRGRPLSG
jgi:hypothetical protein